MKKMMFAVMFCLLIPCFGHAATVELAWDNDPTYANGVTLPDGTVSKLQTVIEMKEKLATNWGVVATAVDGANTISVVPSATYAPGQTLQFRAFAQITGIVDSNGTVGLLKSEGYSNIVEYFIPYTPNPNPTNPSNLIITIQAGDQTYSVVLEPNK